MIVGKGTWGLCQWVMLPTHDVASYIHNSEQLIIVKPSTDPEMNQGSG